MALHDVDTKITIKFLKSGPISMALDNTYFRDATNPDLRE